MGNELAPFIVYPFAVFLLFPATGVNEYECETSSSMIIFCFIFVLSWFSYSYTFDVLVELMILISYWIGLLRERVARVECTIHVTRADHSPLYFPIFFSSLLFHTWSGING